MESNQPRVIYRYDQPSKLDTANYLTLCKVLLLSGSLNSYYIQMNHDQENPKWEYVGICDKEETLLNLIELLIPSIRQ